jgi:hypothetical protein
MGLEGFTNNSAGGLSPGDPLFAKSYNNLAAGADKAQFGPSPGAIFNSTNGGMAMYIESSRNDDEDANLEQFQIVVDPYVVEGVDTGLSIIRVVKGEVVWSPKLLEVPGVPLPPACTTQITIENWFALPTFPVIDDENSIYIGDGGIRVPKTPNIPIGIFIFKATNLPVDVDPIILAAPDYTPTCPVEFPGMTPFPLALWELVKIGSVVYTEADGWKITQNFIGSMTLPGGGSDVANTMALPAQLPSSNFQEQTTPQPFECRIVIDDFPNSGEMLLKIGRGSVFHTKSNMPFVGNGCTIEKKQTAYTKLQVSPAGWSATGDNDNGWMNLGGGYKITGDGQWYLVAFYWDAEQGGGDTNFPLPEPLLAGAGTEVGLPVLALIDAYGANVDKLFVETGPGLYTNTMNIQKMTGYSNVGPGEDDDWGYCHTTYFNPIKLGYDIKVIATIESYPAAEATVQVSVSQSATESSNQIQNIYLPVLPKEGSVVFIFTSLGDPTAVPPIPPSIGSSTPWFPPIGNSGDNICSISLFNALQAIPALRGNIMVTATSRHNFYVTFINLLQSSNQNILVATPALDSWPFKYKIDQLITGNVVLDASPRFDGTQLMNKENMTKNDDPYIVQSTADPAFTDIVNLQDALNLNSLEGDANYSAGLIPVSPNNPTAHQWKYETENGCSDDTCEHPFQVNIDSVEEGETYYSVCSGTVNNTVPDGIDAAFTMADGDLVWIRVEAEVGSYTYPKTVTVQHGSTLPVDTVTYGYIKVAKLVGTTIEQYVTGSLWTDRIQLGTNIPTYYFARV